MTSEGRVRPIRVALDVRMPANKWGGVQQVAQGLARGLSALGGDDEFLFLGYADAASWLDPLVEGRTRRVEVPSSWGRTNTRRAYDAVVARAPALGRAIGRTVATFGRRASHIPRSDGRVEDLGVDVIHFVTPQAYRTAVPSLYQPHDLLHVHEPEQFSPLHRDYRERAYRAFCEQAACVVTMTNWGRSDLSEHYGIDRARIAVVPWPPVVLPPGPPLADTAFPLERFLLYPAQTWPHKNHLVLVSAL
jgi:glycosyltransferase involved in cell wall biosynthesis